MRYPPQILEEIKMRIPLYEVIRHHVILKKQGRKYVGLCPFHNEKSPSFQVNPEWERYHCFGCGVDGDHFTFLVEHERMQFHEAVEKLARQAGVALPTQNEQSDEQSQLYESLYKVNEATTAFFEMQLQAPGGNKAREYLASRGLKKEIIQSFRIGYAPDAWTHLYDHLIKQGFDRNLLLKAGLVVHHEEKQSQYDRFRNRIMFPILDHHNRVIAFGGRVLGDEKPKYLNSPDTPVFNKGKVLYNHAVARKAVREDMPALIVEGYMDVIALAQFGIKTAVAPLGTAMTEDHIRMAWRFSKEPVLCFDGDAAGQKASERVIDRTLPLLQPGTSLRFLTLPTGEDPDSYLRSYGIDAFRNMLIKAQPLLNKYFEIEYRKQPVDTPERRAGLIDRLKKREHDIQDLTVRSAYRNFVYEKMRSLSTNSFKKNSKKYKGHTEVVFDAPLSSPGAIMKMRHQQVILAGILMFPNFLEECYEEIAGFTFEEKQYEKLRQELLSYLSSGKTLESEQLIAHLKFMGYDQEIATIMHKDVYALCGFLRSDAEMSEKILQWKDFLLEFIGKQDNDLIYDKMDLLTENGWEKFLKLRANSAV
jgi:DNA primase